jgi:hypothetical protein
MNNIKNKSVNGSIAVMMIISMPVIITILGLVLDIGLMINTKGVVQAAADFGSLAGAQCLNLDLLAEGVLYIDPLRAQAEAKYWTELNIKKNIKHLRDESSLKVIVNVHNINDGVPSIDAHTMRILLEPTVCVRVDYPIKTSFIPFRKDIFLTVHSDSSVVDREER